MDVGVSDLAAARARGRFDRRGEVEDRHADGRTRVDAVEARDLGAGVDGAAGLERGVVLDRNEACVGAILEGRIPFTGIVDTVAAVVAEHEASAERVSRDGLSLEAVLAADEWARKRAAELASAG